MPAADPRFVGGSRRWLTEAVEASLRRLRTDWIDVYQLGVPDPDADFDETLGALTDLVRAGKIRSFGASKVPASQIVEAQWTAERRGHARFRTEQPPYSMLTRASAWACSVICATACPRSYSENSENSQSVSSTYRCARLATSRLAPGAHRAELPARWRTSRPCVASPRSPTMNAQGCELPADGAHRAASSSASISSAVTS